MSSRAAGGRRRLQAPLNKDLQSAPSSPSSSKPLRSLFSRSKSASAKVRQQQQQPQEPPPIPSIPSPPTSPPRPYPLQEQQYSYSPNVRQRTIALPRTEPPLETRPFNALSSPRLPTSSFSSPRSNFAAYPSPEEPRRQLSPYSIPSEFPSPPSGFIAIPRSPSPTIAQIATPPSNLFLEATYQPPPPPSRSSQPQSSSKDPSPYSNQLLSNPPLTSPFNQALASSSSFEHLIAAPKPERGSLLFHSPSPSRSSGPPSYRTHSPDSGYLQSTSHQDGDYRGGSRLDYRGMYPSPPSSETPLPYRNDHSPLTSSRPLPHPPSQDQSISYQNVSSLAPPPTPTYAASVISTSSSSSRKSRASGFRSNSASANVPKSPKSPGFVFPGSRSTARPKTTSTISGPRKSNKGGKSKSDGEEYSGPPLSGLISPIPSVSGSSSYEDQTQQSQASSSSSAFQRSNQQLPTPSVSSSSSEPSGDNSSVGNGARSPPPTRLRGVSSATAGTSVTTSTTSSNSSRAKSNPGFVYPGGRSRAQPSTPPISMPSFKLKVKGSKKDKSGKRPKRSSITSSDSDGRVKFMGISLKKKKSAGLDDDDKESRRSESPLAFTLALSETTGTSYYDEQSQIGSTTTNGGPAGPEFEAYRDEKMQPEVRRHDRMARIKSRIGSYPLDPYDSVLLDNDRHTGELLTRLNGTGSPTFFDYGNAPPMSVLDLGCGQGHWVVDAAIAWKGHGTKVTGYDLVDISKVLLPWAVKQGVAENIRFVRGNFLKQRLPFADNSFDLVRMSSLTLCITADAWIFVFQEVCRVLTIGGRLEFIDDAIIFPYGKPQQSSLSMLGNTAFANPSTPHIDTFVPPRLDIQIPSSAFSTFSIYGDWEGRNPGLGLPEEEGEEEGDLYDLYQVKEEGESDFDDTATLNGDSREGGVGERNNQSASTTSRSLNGTPVPRGRPRFSQQSGSNSVKCSEWKRHAATARDLEALFEHMLVHKFGIHMNPEEFVMDLMKDVFGHAREVRTMHLCLAHPDIGTGADEDTPRGRSGGGDSKNGGYGGNFRHMATSSPARTIRSTSGRSLGTPLSRSPGLILSPSTFIPMAQGELEIYVSKHLRMLLSCKKFLVEHAIEATDDEEIDEDSVLEALWEYERFLRTRFNPPPDYYEWDKSPVSSDAASTRESIMSVSSDGQDAMWEYQSEMRQRFAWPTDDVDNATSPRSQITPKVASPTSPTGAPYPDSNVQGLGLTGTTSPNPSDAPPYSRHEMTHVRTFRVYEAIKLDENMLGLKGNESGGSSADYGSDLAYLN